MGLETEELQDPGRVGLARNVVGLRHHGTDLEPAVGAGGHPAPEVPLRRPRSEVRVEARGVGLPQVEHRPGERVAAGGAHDPGEDERVAGFVGPPR